MGTSTVVTCDVCSQAITGDGSLLTNVLVQTIQNGQLRVLNLCIAQEGFENGCGDEVMRYIDSLDHEGPTPIPQPEPAPEPEPDPEPAPE